jgi:hypothetical protein
VHVPVEASDGQPKYTTIAGSGTMVDIDKLNLGIDGVMDVTHLPRAHPDDPKGRAPGRGVLGIVSETSLALFLA